MSTQTMTQQRSHSVRSRKAAFTADATWYAALSLLAMMFLFPFFWTAMSSLKTPSEMMSFPPTMFPELPPQWANYARVFEKVPFMTWVYNTLYIVVLNTLGMLISASPGGLCPLPVSPSRAARPSL